MNTSLRTHDDLLRTLFVFFFVVPLLTGLCMSSPAEWEVGMAAAKVTPKEPIFMAGYSSRDHPSEGVVSDLWLKALALTDAEGTRAVLVTSDIIGFRASVAEPIVERLQRELGLKREQILLSSSHTHTGPTMAATPTVQEHMTRDDAETVFEYTQWLSDQVVSVVKAAWKQERQRATLYWGFGVANFVMNRREMTDSGIILGFNPRGPADRSVPILKVVGPKDQILAVVFGAGAHNTTLTGKFFKISGDYAGFAQEYIQKKFPGTQAMFVLGCAGDTNPYPRGTIEVARAHGEALGREVSRLLEEDLHPVNGPLKTEFRVASLPLEPILSPEGIEELSKGSGGWRRWVAAKMTEAREQGQGIPAHYPAPMALWQFGEDLTLVGLSGEVVVDYAYMVEETLGQNRLWVAAYCNDVWGYLPSARVLREGGYETRGVYSGVGLISPKAEKVVIDTIREMGEAVGRVSRTTVE